MTKEQIIRLLSNMKDGDTWSLSIPRGEIAVYLDGTQWTVECVSDEYDESYVYEDMEVAAAEILYYL